MADQYRLEMVGVSKTFPGVKALDGINLKVRPGTVHALMGENGAGKSTLMKILFGEEVPDYGRILLQTVFSSNAYSAFIKWMRGRSSSMGRKWRSRTRMTHFTKDWQWCTRSCSPYRSVPLQRICIWADTL